MKAFAILAAVLALVCCTGAACQNSSVPKPNGVDVTWGDGGIDTCVTWARQHPEVVYPTTKDGGKD